MSRRALVVGCAAVLLARPLAAQRSGDPDPLGSALLARAESLSRAQSLVDSAERQTVIDRRRAQVLRAGRLTAVLWHMVNPELGQHVLTRMDSVVEAYGGGLAEWLDHLVAVQLNATDTARVLAAPGLRRRTVVELDWIPNDDTLSAAWLMAGQIARAYRATLAPAWRHWLPMELAVVWRPKLEGEWALRSLTEPIFATGSGCLAGRVSDCRLWLALDNDARPIATRYRAAEIRGQLTRSPGLRAPEAERVTCLQGDDAACVRLAESHPLMDPIPAPEFARASLMRAVWVRHGPAALSRALRDTTGSVGERLARATGVSEDSLVAEWRTWTLARGRTDRLQATLPQALAVIFAALLVVFLAARSGRWR